METKHVPEPIIVPLFALGEERTINGVACTRVKLSNAGGKASWSAGFVVAQVARRLGRTPTQDAVAELCWLCPMRGPNWCAYNCPCGGEGPDRIVSSDAIPLLALEGALA